MSTADNFQSASRRVDAKSQKPGSAASYDGSIGLQHNRKPGKSALGQGRQPQQQQQQQHSDVVQPVRSGQLTQAHVQAPASQEDNHLNGFDSAEVVAMLKAGVDPRAPLYKPDARTRVPKGSSPWGTKPGAMANGKDFWLELRRQTAALLASDGERRGG